MDINEEIILRREWFYKITLPSGAVTSCYVPADIYPIHTTRLRMMDSVLSPILDGRWSEVTALDLASNQGYFSFHLAGKGCLRVLGLEARQQLVDDATLLARALRLDNVEFEAADATKVEPEGYGQHDVVLCFGLIYHLEDPIGALRRAAAMCSKVLLVETQVSPGLSGSVDWGSSRLVQPIRGTFSLIDEMRQGANPQASITGLALCPDREAVFFTLKSLGFPRVEMVPVPQDGYEQLRTGRRIMVAAYRDA